MSRILVDTNVLVYLFDRGEFEKQAASLTLFERTEFVLSACVSAQNLAEFFHATTRSRTPILSVEDSIKQVERFAAAFPIFEVTRFTVLEAVRGVRQYEFPYYDAQLWATAKLNQVPVIFSEDFNAGSMIEGVSFVNPFAREFDLERWV
jgi:predicted nucleic acid-binding protein